MLVQASRPVVRVPVLSKNIVPREDRASSEAPVRTTMPLQAQYGSLVDESRCSLAPQARGQACARVVLDANQQQAQKLHIDAW